MQTLACRKQVDHAVIWVSRLLGPSRCRIMSQTRKVSYMYDGEVLQAADVIVSAPSSFQQGDQAWPPGHIANFLKSRCSGDSCIILPWGEAPHEAPAHAHDA